MSIEAYGTEALCRGIFPNIVRPGGDSGEPILKIQCNWCSGPGSVFYEGDECEAPDTDWLAAAIKHLAVCAPSKVVPV